MKYNAFISYSHREDSDLAPSLERALEKFAKPILKRRALNIFRDANDLSASPDLWGNIVDGLNESEFFIFLGSKAAALSSWCQKEVDHWKAKKSMEKFLIVITEGELVWDDSKSDFDWQKTTAIPKNLSGAFKNEPLYVDFRGDYNSSELTLENPDFKNKIVLLAATLHHKKVGDMVGEAVRQHRRTLLIRNGIFVTLSILLGLFIFQTIEAKKQTKIATEQRDRALANYFASEANREVVEDPTLALRLVELAIQKQPDDSLIRRDASKIYRENSFYKSVNSYPNIINATALSPDRKFVLIGSEDGTASLWDLNGERIGQPMKHSGKVTSVCFSPDGKTILTGSYDKTIRLWNLMGEPIIDPIEQPSWVNKVSFSQDGSLIMVVTLEDSVRLFDLKGSPKSKPLKHTGEITFAQFSPDGQRIVTGSYDKSARIWDLEGNPIGKPMLHGHYISSIAFSPDGEMILTGSGDDTARLWNMEGNPISEPIKHPLNVKSVTFSPDGKWILTGCLDKMARLWDLKGDLKRTFMGHLWGVEYVAFFPDGNTIITGSQDKTVRLWDLNGNLLNHPMKHKEYIINVEYLIEDQTIFTSSEKQIGRFWYLRNMTIGPPIQFENSDIIDVSPDLEKLLITDGDSLYIKSLEGKQIGSPINYSKKGWFELVKFSSDGSKIIRNAEEVSEIWDLKGNSIDYFKSDPESEELSFITSDGNGLIMQPNDSTLLFTDLNGTPLGKPIDVSEGFTAEQNAKNGDIFIVETEKGNENLLILKGKPMKNALAHPEDISSVAMSSDGLTILTGFDDGMAMLWDLEGNQIGKTMKHPGPVNYVAFSPDGKTILTDNNGNSRLWNYNGEPIGVPMSHDGRVDLVVFYPDGKKFLTAFRDKTQIWDSYGNALGKPIDHNDIVQSILISKNGKRALIKTSNMAQWWQFAEPLKEIFSGDRISPLTKEQKRMYHID